MKPIEAMIAEALGREPGLGRLVSYRQEEDHVRLDFEYGVAKFGLDQYTLLLSTELA